MTLSTEEVRLTDVAEVNPRASLAAVPLDESVAFVPMAAMSAEHGVVTATEHRNVADVLTGFTPFNDGDVLIAKITPCFENGKIGQARIPTAIGFGSTEFHVVRPNTEQLDGRYLHHFLRQDFVRHAGERRMTGSAGQRRVPAAFISNLQLRLPSLDEQRRIANILDKADALRAQRRAALAELDTLTKSIFLDLFGDPVENSKGWTLKRLQDVLKMPLRNGLSPSKAGTVEAMVLTLSAITGSQFDATAFKISTFQHRPPCGQAVDTLDFLICRGNGNVHLVGKGYFPSVSIVDMTFPDTMIAARVDPSLIGRLFLQHVWNSISVRRQLESLARTTNGTFKVNQGMLENVTFISPPMSLQHEFARRITAAETLKSRHRTALAELDTLFASLQHRAFRGEL